MDNGWPQQIGYSFINHNWIMPARYYSKRMTHSNFVVDYFMLDSNVNDAKSPNENQAHNICSNHNWGGPGKCTNNGGMPSIQGCKGWFDADWGSQKEWLERKLAASDADWKIVVTHFPCGYDSEWYKSLKANHGLDLLVTGHRHQQELWWPGTTSHYIQGFMKANGWDETAPACFMTGGGGGIVSQKFSYADYGRDLAWYGFFHLTISRDRIKIELVQSDGNVVGNRTIYQRSHKPSQTESFDQAAPAPTPASPTAPSTQVHVCTGTGESCCEGQGYDEDACVAVGCCNFDGGCWSAVGGRQCATQGSSTPVSTQGSSTPVSTPAQYRLFREAGLGYCADDDLFKGFSSDATDCERKCSADPDCMFFSIWETTWSWQNLWQGRSWCRLTTSCDAIEADGTYEIAIWKKVSRANQASTEAHLWHPNSAPAPVPPPADKADIPEGGSEFYMYRATSFTGFDKNRLGDVNTGNLEGVMWYLEHEVVTMYANGVRCPRKYGITTLHRFKVRYLATPELRKEGMHMGVRFTYDNASCMGRCFGGNKCTGEDDCVEHFGKYGHVIGCNNFRDYRPFPDIDTQTPNGIWYSLPTGGRCADPDGRPDCTWSVEDAGEIALVDVEKQFPGQGNCCNGVCSSFWDDPWRNAWRAERAKDHFTFKYPKMPRDLGPEVCDFNWDKWYNPDKWQRRDPWKQPFWDQKHHRYLDIVGAVPK
jgi:hypothetical protein